MLIYVPAIPIATPPGNRGKPVRWTDVLEPRRLDGELDDVRPGRARVGIAQVKKFRLVDVGFVVLLSSPNATRSTFLAFLIWGSHPRQWDQYGQTMVPHRDLVVAWKISTAHELYFLQRLFASLY